MAKVVFFIVAFHLLAVRGECQQLQRDIDSLEALLRTKGVPDTTRLHELNELSYLYYAVDPGKGLQRANEAVQLASRLKHTKGLAIAYSRKGINHWARGEDSLASEATNMSLALHKQAGNWLNYAKGLNNRALNAYNQGNFRAAIRDHEESLLFFSKVRDTSGIQHAYTNMGVVFLALNDYPRALQAFLDAERYSSPKSTLQGHILTNIGLVYKNTHDYPKAFAYQQQALNFFRKTGDKQNEANALGNLAALYELTKNTQKAIDVYFQALNLNRTIGNDRRIAADLTNIGSLYRDRGQRDEALRYLQQAVDTYAKTNDKNGTAEALLQLAEVQAGRVQKLDLLQKALDAARQSESPLRQSEVLATMSSTYESTGDYKRALQLYKSHVALQDSIFNTEKSNDILRQQMDFDFEKKETLAQAEIRRQKTLRNTFLFGGVTFFLLIGSTGLLYTRKKDAESREARAEQEIRMVETELKALRAQMNPHFIFNALNAIADSLSKNELPITQSYLMTFAKLMRMALENSAHREIPLLDELEFLELYLQIEQLRLKHNFSYSIRVDQAVDPGNVLVPPMLLQPILENSIWHGIASLEGQGHIEVCIRIKNHMLLCSVTDNGVGISPIRKERPTGAFGIRLTEERLTLLNRQQQVESRLEMSEGPNGQGLCTDIYLPLKPIF